MRRGRYIHAVLAQDQIAVSGMGGGWRSESIIEWSSTRYQLAQTAPAEVPVCRKKAFGGFEARGAMRRRFFSKLATDRERWRQARRRYRKSMTFVSSGRPNAATTPLGLPLSDSRVAMARISSMEETFIA